MSQQNKSIVLDTFTMKFLKVYTDLVAKRVVLKKKDMWSTIDMLHSNFNSLEKRERNFPEAKRMRARAALLEKFGVNPEYLDGRSEIMYVKEPEPVTETPVLEAVEFNFQNIAEKTKVLAELEHYKKLAEEQKAEIDALRIEITRLKTKAKTDE